MRQQGSARMLDAGQAQTIRPSAAATLLHACHRRVFESAISPSSSPSQDQPSIADSTDAIPLSVRFCPLLESTPECAWHVADSIPLVPPPGPASCAQPAGCSELGVSIVLWASMSHSPLGECGISAGLLARTPSLDINRPCLLLTSLYPRPNRHAQYLNPLSA